MLFTCVPEKHYPRCGSHNEENTSYSSVLQCQQKILCHVVMVSSDNVVILKGPLCQIVICQIIILSDYNIVRLVKCFFKPGPFCQIVPPM